MNRFNLNYTAYFEFGNRKQDIYFKFANHITIIYFEYANRKSEHYFDFANQKSYHILFPGIPDRDPPFFILHNHTVKASEPHRLRGFFNSSILVFYRWISL